MNQYQLLSKPIRKYIYDMGWKELRPIQYAAIEKITSTNQNYILSSKTASGKTEAAFLPILSKIDFKQNGIQVLYISPLVTLINDQFYRIFKLCEYLKINITKWHGDANITEKNKIISDPKGIILITPESLEAMFVNKPQDIKILFHNLKYVIVDEIHFFINSERGIQLKSLLYRLLESCFKQFVFVGLSATISDYEKAKEFTGNKENTKILVDHTKNNIRIQFKYFDCHTDSLSNSILVDIYNETRKNDVLIFPNSRERVEEIAVKLKSISRLKNGHGNYFSHHSSIDKEVRESIESFTKQIKNKNFCICCTSTLELGIDIGTVEKIIQVDATMSISSLIQRIGRSGRRDGKNSDIVLYSTDEMNLVQSIACWLLYNEGFIEPASTPQKPYDILLHQILSIVKSSNGIKYYALMGKLIKNHAFCLIEENDIKEIINHLLHIDLLQNVQNEIVLGLSGEKIVNDYHFYSVFKNFEEYQVINKNLKVGKIHLSKKIKINGTFMLGAKIWKIISINNKYKRIDVIESSVGKKPYFFSEGAVVHPRIREKMFEILVTKDSFSFLDNESLQVINVLRKNFSTDKNYNLLTDRPLFVGEESLLFYSFTGTKINETLSILFIIFGIEHKLHEFSSSFLIKMKQKDFLKKWKNLSHSLYQLDEKIEDFLNSESELFDGTKWSPLLPQKQQNELNKQKYLDIKSTINYINTIRIV